MFANLYKKIEPYINIHLKRKNVNHFGDAAFVSDIPGNDSVICFKGTALHILNEEWYRRRCLDDGKEEIRILKTAAKIIQRDIKAQAYECSLFPMQEEVANGNEELVPASLSLLISEIKKPVKQTTSA